MARYGTFKHQGIPLKLDDGCYGEQFFVDGTNGNDGNVGTVPGKAFKTIQYALDKQIENATGLGDKINVFPGTYAETLAGDLSKVSIVGSGVTPNAVLIQPTDGNAFSGAMVDSAMRNMTFYSPDTSNTTYAAVRVDAMTGSVIDSCHFYAGAVSATSTAFRRGTEAGDDTWTYMERSAFTNNLIGIRGAGKNFYFGIVFGLSSIAGTGSQQRVFQNSLIAHNTICAESYGILLNVNSNSGNGGLIYRNNVGGGALSKAECGYQGIQSVGHNGDNALMKVVENYVAAAGDAIKGFQASNVFGNYVSVGRATPTRENPAGA